MEETTRGFEAAYATSAAHLCRRCILSTGAPLADLRPPLPQVPSIRRPRVVGE
uniref:Uncharacterized protein n=1 Tax=Oryza sativa subsp. japonica TaxID=39947 RepID=Q6H4U0_ORYSJ|nr:hypothetical protein [Oryza sativa Japonica Group]